MRIQWNKGCESIWKSWEDYHRQNVIAQMLPLYSSESNLAFLFVACKIRTSSKINHQFSSVQFSHSVVFDSLWPHELQHARPPCPSPTPGIYSNSCPSSQWCHPAISSSVVPFSSCPQSLPASGSFPMSQLFASGGQSIGISASKSTFQWIPRTYLL